MLSLACWMHAGCLWDSVFDAPGPGMEKFVTSPFSDKHVLWCVSYPGSIFLASCAAPLPHQ